MRRPRILIPSRRYVRKDKYVQFLGEYHLDVLAGLGAMPLIVPATTLVSEQIDSWGDLADGLLMVEGEDVAADRHEVAPEYVPLLQEPDLPKDEVEFALAKRALEEDLPTLGVCRGSHIMNILAGGSLYADVTEEFGTTLKHINYDCYDTYRHDVRFVPESPLAECFDSNSVPVTSYHHQGVKVLAGRFTPMAWGEDDLLEAFYDPAARYMWGLQFHPERQLGEGPGFTKIFERFVDACRSSI